MNKRQQVNNILDIASKSLAKRAQKAVETGEFDPIASGSMNFLMGELAALFLTKKQQGQVKTIMGLYDRCLFPLAYVSEQEETGSTVVVVQHP